jgi:hypothetical protein
MVGKNTMSNPLERYFRQPAIYIKLPSDGQYYPEGAISVPVNREFPVYPMTAMDEITLRTADALFNGNAVINVVRSCLPNILEPWHMPGIDIDTVLVAIRIASYGHDMDIESKCPQCEEVGSFTVDLRQILERIGRPDFGKTVSIGDLEIFFKPISYKQQNQNSIAQFEDQKLIESVPDSDISEEDKLRLINEAFVKLGQLSISTMADSISAIKADDDLVTERSFIDSFVQNCDRKIYTLIRDHLSDLRSQMTIKPLAIACNSCQHQYETPFTLDASHFFVSGS